VTATYADYDEATGNMNGTMLRPFVNKVLANQGPQIAPNLKKK